MSRERRAVITWAQQVLDPIHIDAAAPGGVPSCDSWSREVISIIAAGHYYARSSNSASSNAKRRGGETVSFSRKREVSTDLFRLPRDDARRGEIPRSVRIRSIEETKWS